MRLMPAEEAANGSPSASTSASAVDEQPSLKREAPDELPKATKRTKTGCLICRRRRVKCDEKSIEGSCGNCLRYGETCLWDQARAIEQGGKAVQVSTFKPRARKACGECRAVKAKCTAERPSCSRCVKKELACVYTDPAARRKALTITELAGEHDDEDSLSPSEEPSFVAPSFESLLSNKSVVISLTDTYFTKFYPVAYHGFLHRETTRRQIENGTLDQSLLMTICALGAFLENPSNSSTPEWLDQAATGVSRLLVEPTVAGVAAAIHISIHSMWTAHSVKLWMMAGLACRAAYALRLNFEPADDSEVPWIEQESNRRLMWACLCLDGFISGGMVEIQATPVEAVHVTVPVAERNFVLGIPAATPPFSLDVDDQTPSPLALNVGILGQHVSLMVIRRLVIQYIFNVKKDPCYPWEANSRFNTCRAHILAWELGLNSDLSITKENILARNAAGQLNQLFALRLFGHMATVNLHRIAIGDFKEAAEPEMLGKAPEGWIRKAQQECFTAATRVLDTAREILSTVPDYICLDFTLSMGLFESSRIQLWALTNLYSADQRHLAYLDALPRIQTALSIFSGMANFSKWSAHILTNLRKLLKRSPLSFLVHSPASTVPASGPGSPRGDYISVAPPQKNEFIHQVHYQLEGLARRTPVTSSRSDSQTPVDQHSAKAVEVDPSSRPLDLDLPTTATSEASSFPESGNENLRPPFWDTPAPDSDFWTTFDLLPSDLFFDPSLDLVGVANDGNRAPGQFPDLSGDLFEYPAT
ncbi:hypothetical protein T439DRAFT_321991 [Meredithblackwellia eburnea MCA 4105]